MDWHARISRPGQPAVPIYAHGMRRGNGGTFWVPPRYWRLANATLTGRRFRHRDLARSLGYSRTGLGHAIERMRGWGLLRIESVRGRLGWTRLVWARDVSARPRNVPSTISDDRSLLPRDQNLSLTVVGTLVLGEGGTS